MTTETPDSAGAAPPAKKSNLVPILIVVGIVVVLVIGAGAYFLTRDDDSETVTGDPPPRIAKDLYAAWQDDDRAKAATIATPDAVTAIFAVPVDEGSGLEFGGCEKVGNTPLPKTCVYSRPGGELTITVSVVGDERKASRVLFGPAGLPPDTTG